MRELAESAAEAAESALSALLVATGLDTADVLATNDIPAVLAHFAELRLYVEGLRDQVAALQKHLDMLSHEALPTMFGAQNIKTITVVGLGRATIVDRWSASMLDRAKAMDWLRQTGNEGLVIETVNAGTLGAFARQRVIDGEPLPDAIFKVSSTPHVSITKE